MPPGELEALRWADVDWERGRLAIRRSLSKANGQAATIEAPKSARGRRLVSLPEEATEALRRHRQRQLEERLRLGPDYDDRDLVFASQAGTPLQHRNVIRAFKALLQDAGLPGTYRIYDLRHAHATALFAAGVHPKAASERLGHSSVALTLDTYSHKVEGIDADAAEKAHRIIRGAKAAAEREPAAAEDVAARSG